ncbi:hypothetical protein NDU88_010601 [Pleurodeles waltl]|uniref:Uncharacterized protein n=1 Tax=Pleurodeles waltl TaxID=8319 RepID=A0AAV7QV61_PLEWA|nr:hypothetical protein NDU88_010601 [Pleurodeles waltl]
MTCLRHGRKAGGYWAAQNGRSRRRRSCGDRSISALGIARSPSEEISALSTGLPKHQGCLTTPTLLKKMTFVLSNMAATSELASVTATPKTPALMTLDSAITTFATNIQMQDMIQFTLKELKSAGTKDVKLETNDVFASLVNAELSTLSRISSNAKPHLVRFVTLHI